MNIKTDNINIKSKILWDFNVKHRGQELCHVYVPVDFLFVHIWFSSCSH